MKNFLILQLLYFYFIIIQLSLIKSSYIFKQIEQNDEIIYINPYTLDKIYYTTLNSSYMIENDEKQIIKENIFNFTSSTRISLYDEANQIFFASCTKNNFVEIFSLSGSLINVLKYNNFITQDKKKFICPIHYYHSISLLEIGFSFLQNNEQIKIGYYEYEKKNEQIQYKYAEAINLDIGNYVTIDIDTKMHFQQIIINNKQKKIYKQENYGLVLYDGKSNIIEDTKSEFKIAFIDQNDAIIYYFENYLKLYYLNKTGYYSYEIDTYNSFDFDNLELSEMINNGNEKKFICVYKSKENNNLFIEIYKLKGNKFQLEKIYEFLISIGISKIYIKKVNQSSEHFILIRGSDINKGKYVYFSKENIDSFENINMNCISAESFLTTSNTNLQIKLSDNNLSPNKISISPNDLNYEFIDNKYIKIIITKDNGNIEFNLDYKIIDEDDNLSSNAILGKCIFKIQICNIACSHCTQIESENKSPTRCTPKRCNNGYYYLENDETECVKSTLNCYETCNTCTQKGNGIDHKCKSCKFGYEKYKNNCIKCDMNRHFWYYDSNKNNNECFYNDNCPNDYPYLIENLNQCVNSCPNETPLITENSNKCISSCPNDYPYLIENLKQCVNNCPNDFPYLIENTKKCVSICPNDYPYLIENLKQCVNNCPNDYPYLIENLKQCVNSCPNDYHYLIENTNKCINNCPSGYDLIDNICMIGHYYYYSNNEKVILGINGCDNLHPYNIYNSKECLSDCLLKNLYLIYDSKICIDKCEKVNLILKNKQCNKKQSYIINGKTLDDLISKVEEKLDKIKDNEDVIIETLPGVIINVINSTTINDINSNYNLGSVDLGECENILKSHYNLDPSLPLLIILINTNSKTNSLVNNVNYNVYSQDGEKLDLSLCSDVKIVVYNSISKDDAEVNLELIKQLSEKGINLFDINDEFYQDRCLSFALNGNDVCIDDRKDDIYTTVSVCEPNCTFIEYNEENNRVQCDCNFKYQIEENVPKKMIDNFFKKLNDEVNYELVKCHRVFLYFKKNFYKNFGFWLWLFTLLSILIGNLLYFIYVKNIFFNDVYSNFKTHKINNRKAKLMDNLQHIFNPPKKMNNFNIKNSINTSFPGKDLINEKNKLNSKENNIRKKSINIIPKENNKIKDLDNNLLVTSIYFKSTNKTVLPSENNYLESQNSKVTDFNYEMVQTENNLLSKIQIIYKRNKNANITNDDKSIKLSFLEKLGLKYKNFFNIREGEEENYWDMTYEKAIDSDNRYFLTCFFSFIFIKLELLTMLFLPENFDYYVITIPFYILSLFIDFTFNSLFYTDHIVSEKYNNDGKLSFLTEILLAFVSNLFTSLIIRYLRKLICFSFAFDTLSHEIRDESHYNYIAKSLLNVVNKKLIANFVIELILCFICGYYLYIFCEVYHMSQISLLINFLIGLVTSIVIVLIIAFIVCILRYIALKCKYKKIYYSSKYISDFI